MWYTVRHGGVSLGVVDLPSGLLVAARLERHPGYVTVEETVRRATSAFLQLGAFGAAAPLLPPVSAEARARRRAMARAARLELDLIGAGGERALTSFVNLLEAPADGGVIVLASFHTAPAMVGAVVDQPPRASGGSVPPTAER